MDQLKTYTKHELAEGLGQLNTALSGLQRNLLSFVREYDRRRLWERDGYRHMGHWLAAHFGVTISEGLRWTTAAHALEKLPSISGAFERGVLSFDKVLQLARFATPEDEKHLLKWATRASVNAIRRKADLANRPSLEETRDAFEDRFLEWWWHDDGTRLGIGGLLPADGGAALVKALEGLAQHQPRVPCRSTFEQRCADALVELAIGPPQGSGDVEHSAVSQVSEDDAHSPEKPESTWDRRAEVVLNIDLTALSSDGGGCHLEGGPTLPAEVARRMSCDCRLRTVLRDPGGRAVGIGRRSRNIPKWLMRELLSRDYGCTFPGCGTRRFLAAHHIVHWAHGGATDLDNLVLLCSFHHRLVHEGGWKVRLVGGLLSEWSRPNGFHYEPALPRTTRDGPLETHPHSPDAVTKRDEPPRFFAPPRRAGPIREARDFDTEKLKAEPFFP